jgi:hypothetical protein
MTDGLEGDETHTQTHHDHDSHAKRWHLYLEYLPSGRAMRGGPSYAARERGREGGRERKRGGRERERENALLVCAVTRMTCVWYDAYAYACCDVCVVAQ